MTGKPQRFTVAFNKQTAEVQLPAGASLQQLGAALADRFGVAFPTIKLFLPGSKAALKPAEAPTMTLHDAGIRSGARLKMLASRQADVAAVQSAKEDSRTPGFDHELRRELRRSQPSSDARVPPSGEHGFKKFEVWQRPGLMPPPSEALKLLHRLASDPGILGVMNKHKWAVGLLSEMPPEGKVGISPMCILGVNINKGQEISLRLRTDDLKGFRRYDRIRETLLHELAHMVWGEHDDNFKQLNSQLRRECESFDWRGAGGQAVQGPAFQGEVQYELPPEHLTVMQQTAASSGSRLGSAEGGAVAVPADAKQAAAEAAARRAATAAGESALAPSGPLQQGAASQPPAPPAQPQQPSYSKGQQVLYRDREGIWQEAQIAAVDQSVLPHSYGIEIDGRYRETEASRLAPLPQVAAAEQPIEGLGHADASTEAKEAAVAALEH